MAEADVIFRRLDQLLRLLLVAEWIHRNKIPLNLDWIERYASEPYPMPRITPGLTVSRQRVTETVQHHKVGDGTEIRTRTNVRTTTLSGGVSFQRIEPSFEPPDEGFDAWVQRHRDVLRNPRLGGAAATTTAMAVAGLGARNHLQAIALQLQVQPPTGPPLRLHGRRNRRGLLISALPRLRSFNPTGRQGKTRTMSIPGVPESTVEVRTWQLFDVTGTFLGQFETYKADPASQRILVLPTNPDNPWRLYPQADGILWARGPDNQVWAFDAGHGRIIAERHGDRLIHYSYTGQGRLERIETETSPDKTHWIRLERGCGGRCVLAATGSDGSRRNFRDGNRLRRLRKLTAYNEGGESASVRLDGGTGDWTSNKPIGRLDYLDRRGLDLADAFTSNSGLSLIPDGGRTLVLARTSDGTHEVRPLPFPIEQPHDLMRALRKQYPKDRSIVAMEPMPDGRLALRRQVNGARETLLLSRDGTTVTLTGQKGLDSYRGLQRQRVTAAPSDTARFVKVKPEGDLVRLLVGGKEPVSLTRSELEALKNDPFAARGKVLDRLFDNLPRKAAIVVYRDIEEREVVTPPKGTESAVVLPVALLTTQILRRRYAQKGRLVRMDDDVQTALRNLEGLEPIRGLRDIAFLIPPPEQFQVDDRGSIKRIRKRLKDLGVHIVEEWSRTEEIPNVLLISGHNDAELVRYLTDLGERGLLRDRVLLLNTCYADSNSDLFHRLIDAYGPKAVLHHGSAINPLAVEDTVVRAAELLNKLPEGAEGFQPDVLLHRAVESLLEKEDAHKQEKGDEHKSKDRQGKDDKSSPPRNDGLRSKDQKEKGDKPRPERNDELRNKYQEKLEPLRDAILQISERSSTRPLPGHPHPNPDHSSLRKRA